MQAFEKPAMEFNLRPPPMYAAQRLPQPVQRFPLNPIQAQNSALNKDPIDSFERAIGGDEFDDRPPVEPIRVIKIESAEVIEPVGSSRKMGSNPVKTKKIIQSLTRHLNEVRRPKVIPFSNRDEIINGQVVSQPEVKVTKVEAEQETETAADMDVSSSEIANGILENILNENSFAKNASDLLRVLTKPEQTTTEANEASNGTETGDSSIEVSTELTGSADNDTDSSFLNFDNIDEKLNVIGSEVDDYGVDEEWEEFSSADGGSAVSRRPRPPGRASTRRATAAPVTSTISPRGSITTSSPTTSPTTRSSGANNTTSQAARTPSIVTTSTTTTSTTTTAPQSGEAAPELEADLDESKEESAADEEAVATTATTSASSTSAPPASTAVAEEEDSDKSTESSEESSDDEEETTAITTTAASEAATTTTTFDDGFREAVKAQQAEVLRMRKGGNNEEKAIEAGSSEVSENVEDEKPEITDEDKPEDAEEEKPTKKKGKIRTGNLTASLKDAPNAKYYYPPKVMVPLPSCFYNPSGYVCCNLQLNNLIEDTFEEIKNVQGYSACNIAKVANIMQQKSEQMFEHPFESIVALSDFAQNVHFAGDLVCKVEIDGKYMLTYATPYDADHAVEAVGVAETPPPEMNEMRGKDGKRKTKKPNKAKKKSLPIHNFRM
ncbi:ground-like domain protein [Ancylostoma ceylanicum]|uniref:Ground-like domain protein n=1 Tax=Ancylostoma ceylanicum TaxID=53326 RepID=A0A0D6LNW6_9BILA|nr:ground-like domain protein [Ancylostoma ceylanicum]